MTRTTTLWSVCVVFSAFVLSGCTDRETAKQRYLRDGDNLLAQKKYNEAIVQYRNAIRQDAQFGQARWQLANAYLAVQNTQAAVREYVRAADLLPDRTDAQLMTANILLMSRQFPEARGRAEKVLAREPKNVDALIARANAMAGLKDLDGAVREMRQTLGFATDDSRVYTNLGALEAIRGDRKEAEAAFKKAVAVDPKSVAARIALANYYLAIADNASAEQALKETVAMAASDAQANKMLAALYIRTGRLKEAEQPLTVSVNAAGDAESKVTLADYYLQTNRAADAKPILQGLTSDKKTFPGAAIRLAGIARAEKQSDAAYRLVAEVIKAEPRNALALSVQSEWRLQDRNVKGALESAEAAVKADPGLARAHYALGTAQLANRNRKAAIDELNEVLRLAPRMLGAQVLMSRLQLAAGDADSALQYAAQATATRPGSVDAQLALVNGHLGKGNVAAAFTAVTPLIMQFPQLGAVQYSYGRVLLARNDVSGARTALTRALSDPSTRGDALAALLSVDRKAKTLGAAVVRIEEYTAKEPNNATLHYLAAQTYAAVGEQRKTEQELRRVIELAPDTMEAYVMLGRLYVAQRRLDEARTEFDRAVARRPNEVAPATMAAMILQMQNKQDEARKRYEAIVAQTQTAPIAANNLAWIYAEAGQNLDTALQLAQAAKAQLPESPEVDDTLGWVYVKKNLPQLAIPMLQASVTKDPKNASYQYHLGVAYAKSGDAAKARGALQRAVELQPNSPDGAAALKTLRDVQS